MKYSKNSARVGIVIVSLSISTYTQQMLQMQDTPLSAEYNHGSIGIVQAGFFNSDKPYREDTTTSDELMKHGDSSIYMESPGAVTVVKGDELTRGAVFSVRKALQGKIAGVNVIQNSGHPGKNVAVYIRGIGTINNNNPLYIVDGLPTKNIDYLNVNDIESLIVLKDAPAAGIHGIQGANGVVMVTTKKGSNVARVINYDMFFGISQLWKKPSMCNAEEWALLHNEARTNAGEAPDALNISGEGTDWFKEIIRMRAYTHLQNVSIAQRCNRFKYYISGGLFNQDGIITKSDINKVMLRFNEELKITKWMTIGSNISIGRTGITYANEQDEFNSTLILALSMDPVTKVRDADGNYLGSDYNTIKNPVGRNEYYNTNTKNISFIGSIYATTNLVTNITMNTLFGVDMLSRDSTFSISKYYIAADDYMPNDLMIRRTGSDNNWVFENVLTYTPGFSSDNVLNLRIGTIAQKRELDSVYTENEMEINGLAEGNALLSIFGSAEYEHANRYLLAATFHADGSSRFAEKNQWRYFPSIAGIWNVSNEDFMSALSFIEGLKLKVGWGIAGNQEDDGDYIFLTTESNEQDHIGSSTPNKRLQIHWEEQVTINTGIDLHIFGGRIGLSADYFVNTTNKVLVRQSLPSLDDNGGEVQNTGFNITLDYHESIGDFSSDISLNFSRYNNKVLNLGGEFGPIMDSNIRNTDLVTRTEVGHPMGSFYALVTDGLFQTQDEVDNYTYTSDDGTVVKIQPNAKPGDIKFKFDSEHTSLLRDYIGNPHPDFTVGLNTGVTFKGFDLYLSLYGVYGNEIFNGVRWYTDNVTAVYGLDSRMLDRWTEKNSTNDVATPRMNYKDANNILLSDRYIEDGSYLRLLTLQIGYSIQHSFLKRVGVSKCRIHLGAQNLFTFTRYSGLEPEIGVSAGGSTFSLGIDQGTYPQIRTFMVGVNVTL